MPNLEGKVCLNHTDTPATTRCLTCFKHLCQVCVVSRNGDDFCSETCATNHATTNQHFTAFQEREKARKARERMKRIAIVLVLLAIGVGIYWYWSKNRSAWDKTKDSLLDGSEKLKEGLQKTINK